MESLIQETALYVVATDRDTCPALTRANTADSVVSADQVETTDSTVDQVASPVEFIPGHGLDSLNQEDSEAAFRVGSTLETEVIESSKTAIEVKIGKSDSSRRRAPRRLSRLEIVCDKPEDYFDIVPGPKSPDIVSRSVKMVQQVRKEVHSSSRAETLLYYLPKEYPKAKGATAGRKTRKG